MIKLEDREVEKLSAITGMDMIQTRKVIEMGIIDEYKVLDYLIKYDWRRLKQRGKYKVAQIIEALMERYKVQKWRVEKAIYSKKTRKLFCQTCQKEISGREYNRGHGQCDECIAKTIDF